MKTLNLCALAYLLLAVQLAHAVRPTTRPDEGIRKQPPAVHAIVGARIVVAPGRVIEQGTIVFRDGVIQSVGRDVKPPQTARIWPAGGLTVYAGLIDAYGEIAENKAGEKTAAKSGGESNGGYWNSRVTPQRRAADLYKTDAKTNAALRSQGVALRLLAPSRGIIKGSSALVTTEDRPAGDAVVKDEVALHVSLTTSRSSNRQYPNSPMGAYALVRQAFYDARWHGQARQAHQANARLPRPEYNVALDALQRYIGNGRPVVIDSSDELYLLRADRVGKELGLRVIVRGSGNEYRRLQAVAKTGRAVIVPLNFSKPPNVATAESARNTTLARTMHWDMAPENPGRLAAAGVKIALTSHGLSKSGDFLKHVRRAIRRGLNEDEALRALTVTPATLLGVEESCGTVEAGKCAHLVLTDGPLFNKATSIRAMWIHGRHYETKKMEDPALPGDWRLTIKQKGGEKNVVLRLAQTAGGLEGLIVTGKQQAKLTHLRTLEQRLAGLIPGKALGTAGIVRLSAVLTSGDDSPALIGQMMWADGSSTGWTARKVQPSRVKSKKKDPANKTVEKVEKAATANKNEPKPALFPTNFPLGAYGRHGPPIQANAVLFRGATVWTCGPHGVLKNADVLVHKGKITAVGQGLKAPVAAIVVDCSGKHIAPGIIDCHAHIATDGGINESGRAVSAEVRIGDFIDGTDINIYRQLACGVTTSNILHGSANPIGGQNQVIKLRWGSLPEEMKFARAPPGIKFALGENVKQSNWGDKFTTRYPQTRMGVEQIIRSEFQAARGYRHRWNAWRKNKQGIPPRVDLRLEAIAEVVAGERWIHCHSYRQDEILALIRTCDQFKIRIGTFQHVLEGYKVAAEIAKHGAMGSAFSDWWAYKFEVYDAIPYNGAIMHEEGVVVSFNSDSAELARRLNVEAAKAVKYGSVPPGEALKFVTLNAAKQLRIDEYVGSLAAGKDADLVVWNRSPLSTLARCEQTWIDGRKYFDHEQDRAARKAVERHREALIQRILASGEAMLKPGEPDNAAPTLWPRLNIFCDHDHGDGRGRHYRRGGRRR